jgi:hypothetical protein
LPGALRLVVKEANKTLVGADGLTTPVDPHPNAPYVLLTSSGLTEGQTITRLLAFAPQAERLRLALAVESTPVPVLDDWVEVSDQMTVEESRRLRDRMGHRLLTRVSIRNLGEQRYGALRVIIPDATRELLDADGWTDADDPYPTAPYIVLSENGMAMGQTIKRVLSFAPGRTPLRFSTVIENAPIPESYFIARPLPLSAPDPVGSANPDQPVARLASAAAESTDDSAFAQRTRWFYLVNGSGPTADASASNLPYVLMPNGTPPQGAPNPNGGTGVGVEPLDPNPTGADIGAALWKAVPTGNDCYLRSAQSFQINSHSIAAGGFPSLLLGYGITSSSSDQVQGDAPLDLGYVPAFAPQALLSWNQQASPTGDQSDFQRWNCNAADGSLTNAQAPGPLYSTYSAANSAANSQTAFGTPAKASAAQWYAWPDYALESIYQQPAQPFPAFTDGEQLAYLCLSAQITEAKLSAAPCTNPPTWTGCTLSGNIQEQGMRCQYTSASNDDVSICITTTGIAIDGSNLQTSYNGQSFTATDWQNAATQLHQECSDVANVRELFKTYNQILTDIFAADSVDVSTISLDIGLSADQTVNTTGIDIVEGLLNSALSLGDPAAGLIANLMETGVTAAEDAGGDTASNLTETIKVEVSELLQELSQAFTSVLTGLGNVETAILTDWGRLQAIQPLLQSTGFNGLKVKDAGPVVEAAQKAYSLAIMQQLVPLAYGLVQSVAVADSLPDPNSTSSGAFSYETFGSLSGSINTGSLSGLDRAGSPSSAMLNDLETYGANPFELYNGLNGWADLAYGLPFGYVSTPLMNVDCTGSVVTLFSATDQNLTVEVNPSQGEIAAPGVDFSAVYGDFSGWEGSLTLELRPYGYLPIFVTANGHDSNDLTVELIITNDGASVADITFGGDGCRGDDPTAILSQSVSNGWAIDGFSQRAQDGNTPAGLWGTLYQP